MGNEALEVTKTLMAETNDKIDKLSIETHRSIQKMSDGIDKLSEAIQLISENSARHEERHGHTNDRIYNIESELKETNRKLDERVKELKDEFQEVRDVVLQNKTHLKIAWAFAGVVIAAFIGGVQLVSSKAINSQKQVQTTIQSIKK